MTCARSWFNDHVERKAREHKAATPPTAARATTMPPVPSKRQAAPLAQLTQPIKTYKPGEYQFDLVPDEGMKGTIVRILNAQVHGPYRFAWNALSPFVRVGPSDAERPITLADGGGLTLSGVPERRLQGLQDTVDFAIVFEGAGARLVDVSTMPTKARLARTALAHVEATQPGQLPGG